jgi:hypothetical protein
MGATKKVLWALVLVATVEMIVGKHVVGGPSTGSDMAGQENKAGPSEMAGHPERNLAAAARPSKTFAQKR